MSRIANSYNNKQEILDIIKQPNFANIYPDGIRECQIVEKIAKKYTKVKSKIQSSIHVALDGLVGDNEIAKFKKDLTIYYSPYGKEYVLGLLQARVELVPNNKLFIISPNTFAIKINPCDAFAWRIGLQSVFKNNDFPRDNELYGLIIYDDTLQMMFEESNDGSSTIEANKVLIQKLISGGF